MSILPAGLFDFDFFEPLPIQIEVSDAPLTSDAGLLPLRDTERQPRAIFERQDGATGASRRGAHGAARTGGAARHAGPSAERG